MTSLEDLVRDTLTERARDVDGLALAVVAARPSSTHPARRWAAVTTVVVVAAAILAAVVLVAPWRGTPHRDATATEGPTPPAGMQWVSFHGVTLTVPASWVVTDEACASAPDAAGIVLVDPPSLAVICSTSPPDSHTQAVVSLHSLNGSTPDGTPTTLAGHPAVRVDDHAGTYALPDVDAVLAVGAQDAGTVDRVLSSLEYTPVDHRGCAARQHVLTDTVGSDGAAIDLGAVGSAVVCEYGGSDSDSTGYLLGSRELDAADVEALRTVLRSARLIPAGQAVAGVGVGGAHAGTHEYRLRLADGSGLTVTLDLGGRPVLVYDGRDRVSYIFASATAVIPVPHAYPR